MLLKYEDSFSTYSMFVSSRHLDVLFAKEERRSLAYNMSFDAPV